MAENKKKGKPNRNTDFKVREEVKQFAKASLKKFKKNNEYLGSKKEIKSAYYQELMELLPEAIFFVVRYGHFEQNQETKVAIYDKLMDADFIKELKKYLKNSEDDEGMKNIELLPNIIFDIISEAVKQEKESDNDTKFDLEDVTELSKFILKKKIKKLVKNGVPESVAFDCLSIIPTNKILEKSAYYHIRILFGVLYEHSKDKDIVFSKVIRHLIKEENLAGVITFALLERKDKVQNFTEKQKDFYNSVTSFCFETMEDMNKDEIKNIINLYIQGRQRDASQNKDSNRRYFISSVPENEYPKVAKVVSRIMENSPELKKFL